MPGNRKSERGAFTIIFALVVALFIEFVLLALNKNVHSFVNMERKQKETLSQEKVKEIIVNSLKGQQVCRNTFNGATFESGDDDGEVKVQEIRDINNNVVLKFLDSTDIDNTNFFESSGLHEKTSLKIKSISILNRDPNSFRRNERDVTDCSFRGENVSVDVDDPDPRATNVQHKNLTLKMIFTDSTGKEFCRYSGIYVRTENNRMVTCSTNTQDIQCTRQNVTISCCRYVYTVQLTPRENNNANENFDIGEVITKTIHPDRSYQTIYSNRDQNGRETPIDDDDGTIGDNDDDEDTSREKIEIIQRANEDGEEVDVDEDCPEGGANSARVRGFCVYLYNWMIDTRCVSNEDN